MNIRELNWMLGSCECSFPIGLVPGGTGCALNCSLLVMNRQKLDGLNSLGPDASVRNVAVGAATGRTTKLDMVKPQKNLFPFVMTVLF